MKKILIILSTVFVFCYPGFILAQEGSQTIYFFHSSICPHCIDEKKFLNKVEKACPEVKIEKYEMSSEENQALAKEFQDGYGVPEEQRGYVPLTIVGQEYFVGYNDDIKAKIESYLTQDCLAKVSEVSFDFTPFISVAAIAILVFIFLAYKKKWYTK